MTVDKKMHWISLSGSLATKLTVKWYCICNHLAVRKRVIFTFFPLPLFDLPFIDILSIFHLRCLRTDNQSDLNHSFEEY